MGYMMDSSPHAAAAAAMMQARSPADAAVAGGGYDYTHPAAAAYSQYYGHL